MAGASTAAGVVLTPAAAAGIGVRVIPADSAKIVVGAPAAAVTGRAGSAATVGTGGNVLPVESAATAPAAVYSDSSAVWVGGMTRKPVSSPPAAASVKDSVATSETGGTPPLAASVGETIGVPASAPGDTAKVAENGR